MAETATATTSTRRSTPKWTQGGRPAPDSTRANQVSASAAPANPAPPATAVRTADSISSCCISRPRVAPSAVRIAISSTRYADRANSSVAAVAQPMASTIAAAPSSASGTGSSLRPRKRSLNGVTVGRSSMGDAAGAESRDDSAARRTSSAAAASRRMPVARRRDDAGRSALATECGESGPLRHGKPQRGLQREGDVRRHDADDRRGDAVDGDEAADDVRVIAEPPLPQVGAEDHHRDGTGTVVRGVEVAAQGRTQAQHGRTYWP